MLSNYNFISKGTMAFTFRKQSMAGAADSYGGGLPIFHGIGLGICCNGVFMDGGTSIFVPQFYA